MQLWITKNKKKLIAAIILILFLLLNPSTKDLKGYLGAYSEVGIHKDINFFIGSVYSYGDNKYLGIANNFIRLSNKATSGDYSNIDSAIKASDDTTAIDSTIADKPAKNKDPLHILSKNK